MASKFKYNGTEYEEALGMNLYEMDLRQYDPAIARWTGAASNVTHYQFWRHDNKPIELWSNSVIKEKIDYIHNNPIEAGLVYKAENYVYSSAMDYAGENGLLENILVFKTYD